MINQGIGMGIPCPNCNPDGKDTDPNKRVMATLEMLLASHSAACKSCGFVMELIVNDEKNKDALKVMSKVQQELSKLKNKIDQSKNL
ncbi:MAG: hypothetical protein KDD94_07580 [Calditrichaeota bacterium]|nr:hypothetical protein [Calditrichota bacterium]